MGGFAWVTLATNDSYSLGALVLAHSLKQVGSPHQLVVLVTPGVTSSMREKLSSVFDLVQEVNILDSKDETNLRLLKRPELGVTFTKLHCWRLTQFDKCVFLDADTLVLKNCDELFEREELSAAPDVGWPDCFNSGVFVYRPSNDTYEKLVQLALEKGSFDGGDQGLLNLYFSDWATKDISKHLPFIYNLCSTACYSYLPAFKQFGADTKILHFIGASKPWLQYFNTETRKVQPTPDLTHLEGILQHWWNIFCALVYTQLTSEMARSSSDVTHTSMSFHASQNLDPEPRPTENIIWDPWEEYDQNQYHVSFPQIPSPETHVQDTENSSSYQTQPNSNSEPLELKPIQSHNTNAYDGSYEHVPSLSYNQPHEVSEELSYENNSPPSNSFQGETLTSVPFRNPPVSITHSHIPHNIPQHIPQSVPQIISQNIPLNIPQDSQQHCELSIITPKPIEPIPPVQTNESEAAATVCKETALHSAPREDQIDGGLAGAFAKLTLGAPRTAEQSALDDHLRRQGWEVGNIDYMGRDSFDNIWSKICQTIAPTPKTEAPTPTSSAVSEPQTEKSAPEEAPAEVAAPQDTTPKTSETIKPESEPTQSIPSEQSKPASNVQASAEAPKEIKPETPVVLTTEIPVAPTEPLQCPLPLKSTQEGAPVESVQSPVSAPTELAPAESSGTPPVAAATTPEVAGTTPEVVAKAPPADSSTAAPISSKTSESSVPEQTCVIPPKESAPAPQAESAQVSQEPPQTPLTLVEDTKSTPAQSEAQPPTEVQKPAETPSVEIPPTQTAVEQTPAPEIAKPAEAAAVSAPPKQPPAQEIAKSVEAAPAESAPSVQPPAQEITKPAEAAPVVAAPQVEPPLAPAEEILKPEAPEPVASAPQPPAPAQEIVKVPEPAPAIVEAPSTPESVPAEETPKVATEPAPTSTVPAESAPAKEAAPTAAVATAKEDAPAPEPSAEGAAADTSKAKPAAKAKAEGGAAAQPTPPPRKTGGGGKKSKSKK